MRSYGCLRIPGLILGSLILSGCSNSKLKDAEGKRLRLSQYEHVVLRHVVVDLDTDQPTLSEDLTEVIRARLKKSKRWTASSYEPQPGDETQSQTSLRQLDLSITIIDASYPSRSKIVWLGSTHKMTCRMEVQDHATDTLLGSTEVSVSVEPLMGSAAILNGGALGILSRTCVDTRKHDRRSLSTHMAKEIVRVLDRATK